MNIYLVRHGELYWEDNIKKCIGITDINLSEKGIKRAELVGLYLKDNNMPYPAAFITMSPWTDLTNSGTSYKDNFEIDPLFGKSTNSMLYNSSYIGDNDPKNYYISPMFGDFEGFPPMLMQVGTHEVLLSDTLTVAEKAKKSNVDVKVTVYEGMFHVFQMVGDLIPEGKAAWDEVEEFINSIWD